MSPASRYVLKKSLKAGIALLLLLFLTINIAASQFLPTSYFSFVEGDRASAVEMLRAVKLLPEYSVLANRQREIYGQNIDEGLFTIEKNRSIKILQLEQMLTQYPKSRDILYGLYLLYNEEGNKEKADTYLKGAQAIDPMVGKL